jgi:hypothetical protein
MTPNHVRMILEDLDKHTEGEGHTLNVITELHEWCKVAVSWLGITTPVLILTKPDEPPTYLDVSAIIALELAP